MIYQGFGILGIAFLLYRTRFVQLFRVALYGMVAFRLEGVALSSPRCVVRTGRWGVDIATAYYASLQYGCVYFGLCFTASRIAYFPCIMHIVTVYRTIPLCLEQPAFFGGGDQAVPVVDKDRGISNPNV